MANYSRAKGMRKSAPKPEKPYPKFPLTPHAKGAWTKKIKGKIYYFGRWANTVNGKLVQLPGDSWWQDALRTFKEHEEGVHAGNTPGQTAGSMLVKDLANSFLTSKLLLLESGEITPRTFAEYRATTDRIIRFFGNRKPVDSITQIDFEKLRSSIVRSGWGPVRLGNEVIRIRSVFKYNKKKDLLPDEFRKPSRKVMRKHRAKQGKRLFTAIEIRELLDGKTVKSEGSSKRDLAGASVPLRAMILLAINGGLGNSDIGELRKTNVDLDSEWIDFPRPKTGVARRFPLWPETITALRAAALERPKSSDAADRECYFVTVHGHRWVRTNTTEVEGEGDRTAKYVQIDAVGLEFGKLQRRLKVSRRKGLGFYSLRHTFATIGLQTGDRDAVKSLMGHAEGDMLSAYEETGPSDERLRAVTDHVHRWLFGAEGGAK